MLGDDESVLAVLVLPALVGGLGYLAVGPIGFVAGAASVLVVGAAVEDRTDERISELEARVAALEAELEMEPDRDDEDG